MSEAMMWLLARGVPNLNWPCWFLVCLFVAEMLASEIIPVLTTRLRQLAAIVVIYIAGRMLTDNYDATAVTLGISSPWWFAQEAVVGEGVAKSLGLKIGDRVTVVMTLAAGAVNTLDFELVGIFQSFSKEFDARAVRIPLAAAKTLMDTHGVHLLVLQLKDTSASKTSLAAVNQQLAKRGFEAKAWFALSDFYEKTVELYDRQFGVLRLIILIMVLLSVINSVNMTLFERTREFGTMRAIGDRSGWIFRLIMVESFWLGLIGGILGMLLGCLAAMAISAIGIPMPPPPNANLGYTALIRLDSDAVLIAGCIGFVACILAAIMPARRMPSLSPEP